MKILFATKNKGKLEEIRVIMADMGCEIVSTADVGFTGEIVEDGETYTDNALIKARALYEYVQAEKSVGRMSSGDWDDYVVLADDSGLEVDYLDKAPGVYSARYMGEDTSYEIKNAAIIGKLEGIPEEKRTARFVCAVAAVFPDGSSENVYATYEGSIAHEARGTNGFGYDPIFLVPQFGKTDAELPISVKNELSHRAQALRMIKEVIAKRKK